jgi:hypothetical protein
LKNLLIYISPNKFTDGWNNEIELLAKIQIDNSLEMGWKKEDIIIVTNFEYKYRGVKAIILSEDNYCDFSPTATKINAIVDLFEKGLIGDDLYWFHDWDAFQLEPLEVDVQGQIGLTDYGVTRCGPEVDRRWSTGVIFFRKDSKDVFDWIKDAVYKYQRNEEISLLAMCRHNKHGINERIKKIDVSYNLATRKRNIGLTYDKAEKPIKVIHFHPLDKRPVLGTGGRYNNLDVCIYGRNPMNKVLASERLIKLFKKYQII